MLLVQTQRFLHFLSDFLYKHNFASPCYIEKRFIQIKIISSFLTWSRQDLFALEYPISMPSSLQNDLTLASVITVNLLLKPSSSSIQSSYEGCLVKTRMHFGKRFFLVGIKQLFSSLFFLCFEDHFLYQSHNVFFVKRASINFNQISSIYHIITIILYFDLSYIFSGTASF